ncbi:branched-chain amino acid ABC transporter permease [Devosia sp.]|uniref:branched-chain amino acid ABC transporter permease n=1 Tax=Devosia sp. TaxID=1871048 RepID=UPI002FC612F9
MTSYGVERWTSSGRLAVGVAAGMLLILALLPTLASGLVIDKLTTLFVYILLAVMWNLLAGYAGLVSVGQQAFFGVGGYLALRLVDAGMMPYLALVIGAVGAGLVAIPISTFALRLKGGEFAIAMWVIAEVLRIVVMFDPLVQGETGTSLLALNAFNPELRRNLTYWLGLGSLALILTITFWLLRSRIGAAAQAIRDDEEAAASIGIDVMRIKQIIFVLAAFGCALAGTIWLASAITFLPRTNFGVQWTVFMLFMVLVGGLKTFEGPIIGAVIFFLLQEIFGDLGVWYLTGLGVIAVGFALYLPDGLWGTWRQRTGIDLLSGGVMLKQPAKAPPA